MRRFLQGEAVPPGWTSAASVNRLIEALEALSSAVAESTSRMSAERAFLLRSRAGAVVDLVDRMLDPSRPVVRSTTEVLE